MGHRASKPCKPCPYKYRSSAIPCSVLWFFEGFRVTNRNLSPCKTPCLNADVARVGNTFVVLLGLAHRWNGAGLKITKQAPKGYLIGIVLFPLGKVPNVPLSSNIGCPRIGCILDGFIQRDGEEGRLSLVLFLFQRLFDFILYPRTINRMLRKDDQEFVIEPDRLINAVSEFVSNFQIFRSKPAANVFALQIGIEPLGELLILAGIADKARVVFNGVLNQGTDIGNEGIGQACTTQECLRDVSFRSQEGICPDGRGAIMDDGFQSLHRSQINISKDCPSYSGSAEGGSVEKGSAKVGSAEKGSAEGGSAEVGSPEVGSDEDGSAEGGSVEKGSAEKGSAEVGSAEVGSAEVGFDEKGSAEVGSAEVGIAEVGSTEFNEYLWMLLSPCIPGLYSLKEKIKLLLVCHSVHLLWGVLIIERCKPIRKIAYCSFFFPSSYGGVIYHLPFVRSETPCLNANFVRGAL